MNKQKNEESSSSSSSSSSVLYKLPAKKLKISEEAADYDEEDFDSLVHLESNGGHQEGQGQRKVLNKGKEKDEDNGGDVVARTSLSEDKYKITNGDNETQSQPQQIQINENNHNFVNDDDDDDGQNQNEKILKELEKYESELSPFEIQIINLLQYIETARLEQREDEVELLIENLHEVMNYALEYNQQNLQESSNSTAASESVTQPKLKSSQSDFALSYRKISEENEEEEVFILENSQNLNNQGQDQSLLPPGPTPTTTKERKSSKVDTILGAIPVVNFGYHLVKTGVSLANRDKEEAINNALDAVKSGALTTSLAISIILPLTVPYVVAGALIGSSLEGTVHGAIEARNLAKSKRAASISEAVFTSDEKEEIAYNSLNHIPGVGLVYGAARASYFALKGERVKLNETARGLATNAVSTGLTAFALRIAYLKSLNRASVVAAEKTTEEAAKIAPSSTRNFFMKMMGKETSTAASTGSRAVVAGRVGRVAASTAFTVGQLTYQIRNIAMDFIKSAFDIEKITMVLVIEFQTALLKAFQRCLAEGDRLDRVRAEGIISDELARIPFLGLAYNALKIIYLYLLRINDRSESEPETAANSNENGKENENEVLEEMLQGLRVTGRFILSQGSLGLESNHVLVREIKSVLLNKILLAL